MPPVEESLALTQFTGSNEKVARRAFDCLSEQRRGYLDAYLRHATGLNADDRADVIQAAFHQVWRARSSFQGRGIPAWLGYLKTVARRCCVDLLRTRTETTLDYSLEDTAEEGSEDPTYDALTALMDAAEAGDIRHRADILWLGLDPALSPEAHTRRLLAAQLSYLDGGLPWDTVLRLLGPDPPGEPPLRRAALDEWLADPGVLRHLAYTTLLYGNDRLAGRLLSLPADPPDREALDALERQAALSESVEEKAGDWTWAEVAVILWRYRHALLTEQILQREDCRLERDVLTALLDRTVKCFPFSEEMWSLLAALSGPLGSRTVDILRHRGLWQRLAFQYRYQEDLPHLDIRDRLQPAAKHVQTEITPGMLNVWLSNGRLLERLARACRGLAADTDE